MSVSKDAVRGTYYVQCWYKDWTGKRCKKTKRGFKTKKAANAWEVDFLRQMEGTPDMTLNAFYALYCKDMDKKLRNTTKLNKANMIESKILPYLGEKKLAEITPLDILSWQNAIQDERTSNGLHYRDSYLRSISNQLSAMLNHAVRYYNLPSNPMNKVDRMGSKKTDEMKFWTKEEYKAFSREMMDKDASFLLFELAVLAGNPQRRGAGPHASGLRLQAQPRVHHQDLRALERQGRVQSSQDQEVQAYYRHAAIPCRRGAGLSHRASPHQA